MAKRLRDTDDKVLHKRDMRLRFKKLVRAVLLNQQWLDELEDQGLMMNTKKNVALLVRQKRKAGLLTVAEKVLLRTQHVFRTVEERKKLCIIISNLSCFNHIPPKLRARLIPVMKFETIGEDRVLIKRSYQPIMVYFMISGEVEMKKTIYDKATKKMTMISEAIMGAGDLIGEVELLENCTRISTYVTISSCEVLSITSDEFFSILGPFMHKQWLEKKAALRSLSYFDTFTDEQIVRACNYCQLAEYGPLQTIYSEDRGAISCVHFILSGECVILQCLKMFHATKRNGVKTFELISVKETNPNVLETPMKSMKSLVSSFFDPGESRDRIVSDSVFNINELLASSSDVEDEETLQQKKAMRKMGLREIEIACGFLRNTDIGQNLSLKKLRSVNKRRTMFVPHSYSISAMGDTDDFADEETFFDYVEESYVDELESGSDTSTLLTNYYIESRDSKIDKKVMLPVDDSVHIEIDNNDELKHSSEEENSTSSGSTHFVEQRTFVTSETHFIDVGSLTYGGIFGLGEKMAHRVIMARTVVQCLLLPRYWLMEDEQNPGHVWKRRRLYLETSIPSREELFGNFLKTRRWDKFKHDYVQSTLNPNSVNSTQPEDIPIISRIVETRDDVKH